MRLFQQFVHISTGLFELRRCVLVILQYYNITVLLFLKLPDIGYRGINWCSNANASLELELGLEPPTTSTRLHLNYFNL